MPPRGARLPLDPAARLARHGERETWAGGEGPLLANVRRRRRAHAHGDSPSPLDRRTSMHKRRLTPPTASAILRAMKTNLHAHVHHHHKTAGPAPAGGGVPCA